MKVVQAHNRQGTLKVYKDVKGIKDVKDAQNFNKKKNVRKTLQLIQRWQIYS